MSVNIKMMLGNIARKKLNETAEARMGRAPFVTPFQKNKTTSESGSFSNPGRNILLECFAMNVTKAELRNNLRILYHMENYFRAAS